jgi:hypothetical protein
MSNMSFVKKVNVEHAPDWLNLALAVILFVSPWVLGFTAETAAAWTAWATGIVIAILAVAAIVQFAEWEEWASVVLGVWLVVSPWVVGFTHNVVAQWTHIVLGLLIAAVAVWEVWLQRSHRSAAT